MLRESAARNIKPLLSDDAWQALRRLSPQAVRRDLEKARKQVADAERSATEANARARSAEQRLQQSRAGAGDGLTALAKQFGTDKWGSWHHYTPHYARHLGHLRDERFTLLEIGIGGYAREKQGGASLRMWRSYFPKAQILGLDIEDKSFVDTDRIRTYQGSQTDEQLLNQIVDDADDLKVIIDDGSHRCEHIRATFDILYPLLPDDGIYAIEDLQTSYWPRFGGSADVNATFTSMALVKSFLDDLNWEEFTPVDREPSYVQSHLIALHAYHNLVFLEKGENNEKSVNGRRDPAKP
ncbi:class I SAM-dependent methyltransferase [Flexivirga alba]|uniref:Class I SAM-dependent methyltransferase n=1 Tax=Flexivirga alba TaxID=702742 RepID=A0ABW2AKB7_9MICO